MVRSAKRVRSGRRRRDPLEHRVRKHFYERLEDRYLLAQIAWDGEAGDLAWNNPLNWVGDQLPGAADDVTISVTGVTIVHSIGSTTVNRLQSTASLALADSSLTVTGDFSLSHGLSVTAVGAGAAFAANGRADIPGANFAAEAGGHVSLPNVVNYLVGSTANSQTQSWTATGADSEIALASLAAVTTGSHYGSTFRIEAADGGQVLLPALKQITEPSQGDTRRRAIEMRAEGPSSLIDVGALRNIIDRYGTAAGAGSDGRWSSITAASGGAIQSDSLELLAGMSLTIDGTGTMSLNALRATEEGQISVSGQNIAFPQLIRANSTSVIIDGVSADFSSIESFDRSALTLNNGGTANLDSAHSIDGASFYVNDGVTLALPAATHYSVNSSGAWQYRHFQASGTGSVLDLSNLTTIAGGIHYSSRLYIDALDGGNVNLGGVANIVDPDSGDTRLRSIDIRAEGTDSGINLMALAHFIDRQGASSGDSDGRWSSLAATGGGAIQTNSLQSLTGVNLTLDGTGTMSVAALQSTSQGQITVSGQNVALPSLVSVKAASVIVDGVHADFSSVESFDQSALTLNNDGTANLDSAHSIDGASFYVNDGVTLALPAATHYSVNSSGAWQYRRFQASGPGSVLDLSNLTTITGGIHYSSRLYIDALDGGNVNLGSVANIADPDSGDARLRSIDIRAEGTGSSINLMNLAHFVDRQGTSSGDSDGRWSSLAATGGGAIQTSALQSLSGVNLTLDGTGTMSVAALQSVSQGQIAVSGQNVAFPNLLSVNGTSVVADGVFADFSLVQSFDQSALTLNRGGAANLDNAHSIDGASFYVNDGVTLALPAATHYSVNPSGAWQYRHFQASGAGSVLDLSNLTTITGGIHYSTRLYIDALDGGAVNLGSVANIVDPEDGDTRLRSVDIRAVGAGSSINLMNLAHFIDRQGTSSGDSDGRWSSLAATGGGAIQTNALQSLSGVNLTLDGTGTMSVAALQSVSQGQIAASGQNVAFPNLLSVNGTSIVADGASADFSLVQSLDQSALTLNNGGTVDLSSAHSIDGASFYVNHGVTLSLPAVTHYSVNSSGSWQHRYFQASGPNSALDLSNLTTITGGAHYSTRLYVNSLDGGQVNLQNVENILDPPSGDNRLRSIDVTSTGAGSVIRLDSLVNFIDQWGTTSGDSNPRWSTLTETDGGIIVDGALAYTTGVHFSIGADFGPTSLPGDEVVPLQTEIPSGDDGQPIEGILGEPPTSELASLEALLVPTGGNIADNAITYNLSMFMIQFDAELNPSFVDVNQITLTNFGPDQLLGGGDDSLVALDSASATGDVLTIAPTQPLSTSRFLLTLPPSVLVDTNGQSPTDPITMEFTNVAAMADTAQWIAGDGDWNVGTNWSTGQAPAAGEHVSIDIPGLAVTVTLPSGAQVASVQSTESLVVSSGSLTISAPSSTSGDLTLAPGASLTATGDGAVLQATGNSSVDGASLYALWGGQLELPGVTQYSASTNGSFQSRYLHAEGADSRISLPNLAEATGGANYAARLYIEAFTGGRIDLSGLVSITDPNAGDIRLRSIDIVSQGVDSVIDLSSLQTIVDVFGTTSGDVDARWSTLTAYAGGVIQSPNLSSIDGVNLTIGLDGGIDVAQLQQVHSGRLDTSWVNRAFTALNSITGDADVRVAFSQLDWSSLATLGGTLSLSNAASVVVNNVTNLNGGNLFVYDGTSLALPAVTAYDVSSTGNWQYRYFHAEGAGSRIDLSNISSITGGLNYAARLYVRAWSGGEVDLSSTQSMSDPAAGDTRLRSFDVISYGANSRINLSALQSITDVFGSNAGDVDNRWSTLAASWGGVIQSSSLSSIDGVNLTVDLNDGIDVGQLQQVNSGRLDTSWVIRAFPSLGSITGGADVRIAFSQLDWSTLTTLGGTLSLSNAASVVLDNVTNLNGASLFAYDGTSLALPGITSYDVSSNGNWQYRYFHAEGAGSQIDLSNITSITGGLNYAARLYVRAWSGGEVDLSGTQTMSDPAAGDTRLRSFDMISSGANSQINLSALQSMTDVNGSNSGDVDNRWSTLTAYGGGVIQSPTLSSIDGVNLAIGLNGHIDVAQLQQVNSGRLDTSWVNRGFPALASITGYADVRVAFSQLDWSALTTLSGTLSLSNAASVAVDNVTNLNGGSLFVHDGISLALPGVTSYDVSSSGNWQYRYFHAEGAGSRIDLGNINSITGGLNNAARLYVRAWSGGEVDLSGAQTMTDPAAGDARLRSFDIISYGANSQIDLSALQSITDVFGSNSGDVDDRWSTLTAYWGGVIQSPTLSSIDGVNLTVGLDGGVDVAQLQQINSGRLDTSWVNRGFTSLSSISGGADVRVRFSQLDWSSLATLSGTLSLSDAASVMLDNVTNSDGARLFVYDGTSLAIPGVTSYDVSSTVNGQQRFFHAEGAGSRIDLRNIATITAGTHYAARLYVQAWSGGAVDLRSVTTLTDPVTGDTRLRSIDVDSYLAGSLVNLSSLQTFSDVNASSSGETAGRWSTMSASLGGKILTPIIGPQLDGVYTSIGVNGLVDGSLELLANSWLTGEGAVSHNVVNGGRVQPAPVLNVGGAYTQLEGGRLEIELGGLIPVQQHDLFTVTGHAELAGTLAVSLTGGFQPAEGDSFRVMTFSSRNGEFLYEGLDAGASAELTPALSSLDLTLLVGFATGPSVEEVSPPDQSVAVPQPYIDVRFNEPINLATFTVDDIAINGPSGPVLFEPPQLAPGSTDTYRIFLDHDTFAPGVHSVTIGPDVLDYVGNPMNQDGNQPNGDPVNDVFMGDVEVLLPDLVAGSLSVTPLALMFGEELQVSWTVQNPSGVMAGGRWIDQLWLSGDDALDAGDYLLEEVLSPLGGLNAGLQYTTDIQVALPANAGLDPGTYRLILVTDAHAAIAETDETNNDLASDSIEVSPVPLPDLRVNDVLGPASALVGGPIQIDWTVMNAGTSDVSASWQEQVYLSSDDMIGNDRLIATLTYSTALAQGDSTARTLSITLPADVPAGDLHIVVTVDTGNNISELNDANNSAISSLTTNLPAALTVSLPSTTILENASSPAMNGVVTRSGSTAQPLTVTLSSDDETEATLPATVVIPAGQNSTTFPVSAVADGLVDGAQGVTITAAADGFLSDFVGFHVLDVDTQSLQLTLDLASLLEGQSITATVTREIVDSNPLYVSVSVSAPLQLTFPQVVVIDADQASTSFTVEAIDDDRVEAAAPLFLMVSAADYQSAEQLLTVLDDDVPNLFLTFQADRFSEAAGGLATLVTVTRDVVSPVDLAVVLRSSDTSEAFVPAQVVIPGGELSTTFHVSAVDDQDLDGDQLVSIEASIRETSSPRILTEGGTSGQITVLDDDGPTLFVTTAADLVAEGNNDVRIMITRNTGAQGDLVVALHSSDETELLVPVSVTIVSGTNSVEFSAVAVEDNTPDGNQTVMITASADGFTDGAGSLVVSDVDLPDLVVTALELPETVETESFFDVSYRIANQGLAEAIADNATAESPGSWRQRVFLSSDPFIGNDQLVGDFDFEGTMPVGLFFEQTIPVRAPLRSGYYWLVVATDLTDTVTEVIETNNTSISPLPVHVQAAYSATVAAGIDQALAGTPVSLTGSAQKTDGTGPAQFALVNIHVNVRGAKRIIAALTDANGNFSATFTPLRNEGGTYTIGAAHPGDDTAPVQDQFTILGMASTPKLIRHRIDEAGSLSGALQLTNLSDVPLTNLSAFISDKPDNLDVTVSFPEGVSLAGLSQLALNYEISALDASVPAATVVIEVSSDEGVTRQIPIEVEVVALRPVLRSETETLQAAMLRGQQRAVEFTVANVGATATGEINVLLPAAPWLALATPPVMDSLDPGQSATVTLLLTPANDLPLTSYQGQLVLNAAANASLTIPFDFRAVSEAAGDLVATVIDELFYYTAEQPKLAGANVYLRDAISGESIGQLVTDANGQASFENIPEGFYTLEVRADSHERHRSTVFINADRINAKEIFISRDTVEYVWTVEEVEIEDRTNITIESVFETNVPVPTVTIDPPLIDLAELTLVGQTMQIDMTVTNHGLIAAQDLALNFGSHPYYEITPLVEDIGLLPAHSSLTIPVLITRVADAQPLDDSIPCTISAVLIWAYDCGPYHVVKSVNIAFTNVEGDCATSPPPTPGGAIGGAPAGPGRINPVSFNTEVNCDFCFEVTLWNKDVSGYFKPIVELAEDAVNAYLAATPFSVGLGVKAKAEVKTCCDSPLGIGLEFAATAEASGKFNVGPGISKDVSIDVPLDGGLSLTFAGSLYFGAQISTQITIGGGVTSGCNFQEPDVTLTGSIGFGVNVGANGNVTATLNTPGQDPQVELASFEAGFFGQLVYSFQYSANNGFTYCASSPDGIYLGGSVSAFGYSAGVFGVDDPNTPDVNESREYLLEPFENCTTPQSNAATSESFRAESLALAHEMYAEGRQVLAARQQQLRTGNASSRAVTVDGRLYAIVASAPRAGVSALGDGGSGALSDPVETLQQGVCARVRLQIEQEAVMTRTAFEASLELINNSFDDPLTSIRVDVEITDADGNIVNDLFGIRDPVLINLSSVDGSGSLGIDSSGTVSWLMLPSDQAAPLADTVYYVGGLLAYTQNDLRVVIPLDPVPITVRPDAALYLKYFHQRDVFSDDPFTPEIEPAIPFVLGVMVDNRGAGTARNLRITSAQPEIIENEKGLLIDFDIIATQVAGQNLTPSLTAHFGDVLPDEIKVGRWLLTATLQGQFIEYNATFEHVDGLGDPRLSLIKEVTIYELIHEVLADRSFADGKPDFLTNDIFDAEDLPDTLHLSNGDVELVGLASDPLVDAPPAGGDLQVQLTAQMPAGWSYLRMADPGEGNYRVVSVEREDGSFVPSQNYWLTDRTFIEHGRPPVYEDNFHLLDYDGIGAYTITYAPVDQAPPVITDLEEVAPDPRDSAVASLQVTFSEAIDLNTFDYTDLFLNNNGGPQLITPGVTVSHVADNTYRINGLNALTMADGIYQLTVNAAGISDRYGNSGFGVASESWIKGNPPPVVEFFSGVEDSPFIIPIDAIDVTFSEPISLASFTPDDLTLTLNAGGANLITPSVTVSEVTPGVYRIEGLAVLTDSEGQYELTVNAAGVQDLDGAAGFGFGSATWTIDQTGPVVDSILGLGDSPLNQPVATLSVSFNEAIDAGSFDSVDLTLSLDGGANLIDNRITITPLSASTFAIDGLADLTSSDGHYVLTVDATTVLDLAGNAGGNSASVDWVADVTPPDAPANLAISPDTGLVADDAVTNQSSITLAGSLSEPGLTVNLFDVTNATPLGGVVATGMAFSRDLQLAPGSHYVRVQAEDAAGNLSSASFLDVFVDVSEPALQAVSPLADPQSHLVHSIAIRFSERVYGVEESDLQLFVDGDLVPLPPNSVLTSSDNITWTLNPIDDITTEAGHYELRIDTAAAEIADLAGNPLLENAVGGIAAKSFDLGAIEGVVWDDANRDTLRAGNESLLDGWTVFLDTNQNGERDDGERFQVTSADGRYRFAGLTAGMYVVAEVVPDGWEQTYPGVTGANGLTVRATTSRSLTFTGSQAQVFVPGGEDDVVGGGEATDLVELDLLRSDPRFAHLTGAGQTVVVIDTGLDADHPFLGDDADGDGVADRIVYQFDFAENDGDASDEKGHGTHVTSIIASQDPDYPGIAPEVDIIHLKVFQDSGRGVFGDVERALQWVVSNAQLFNVAAVNLSLGDGQNWDYALGLYGLADELLALNSAGVLVMAAAGNAYGVFDDTPGLSYPSADPNTIAVGAVWDSDRGGPWSFGAAGADYTTDADRIASFSQRHGDLLDVFAPGALITAASLDGGIATMRGTSMATPYVTGAAVIAQQLAQQQLGRRLSLGEFRQLLTISGALVIDGDDENDNVHNTGLPYVRLDLHRLAETVLEYDGSLGANIPDGGSSGGEQNHGIGSADGQPFAYTINLQSGQQRQDADFGNASLAVNDQPIADPQTVTTLEDTELAITLTGDDGDADADQALTFILTSLPADGLLSTTSGGAAIAGGDLPLTLAGDTLYFSPAANSVDSQSFDFQVQDDGGTDNGGIDLSLTAMVTIDVTPVNDQPIADPQTVTTLEDTELAITLTGDDGDADADQALTFILTSLPAGGLLSTTSGGAAIAGGDLPLTLTGDTLYFTPAANSVDSQSFDFQVQDDGGTDNGGENTSDPVTVHIDIIPLPRVTLAITSDTILETGGTATVIATLDRPTDDLVTVNLELSGMALDGVDYSITATSITITPGSTEGTATVEASHDEFVEGDETLMIDILTVSNAVEDGVQQANAVITDDDQLPTVVSLGLNLAQVDPPDRPGRPQPTSWRQQRSDIRDITIQFNKPVVIAAADVRLTNLGVDAPVEADVVISLTDDQLAYDADRLTIQFDRGELLSGVYKLEIFSSVTDTLGHPFDGDGDGSGGDAYVLQGTAANGFFALFADWKGDAGITIFDFPVFSYWFGAAVPTAPDYVDLNEDGGISIFDFPAFSSNFGKSLTFPVAIAASLDQGAAPRDAASDRPWSAGSPPEEPLVQESARPLAWTNIKTNRPASSWMRDEMDRAELNLPDLEQILDEIGGDVLRGWRQR